jgi:predicted XRE-type DNA-binding protein
MSKMKFIKSSGNVFKDVGFDEFEAKSLQFRSHLMNMLMNYIQHEGLTQKEAAKCLGVSQPRISNLIHGKIDLFSTGMLLEMMERAGFPVYKKIETDVYQFFKKFEGHHSARNVLSWR